MGGREGGRECIYNIYVYYIYIYMVDSLLCTVETNITL